MKKEQYFEWLINEKNFSIKVAKDMSCRATRVCRILEISDIDNSTIQMLENSEEFKSLSVSVRSQLRRTCSMYNEFIATL